MARLDLRQRSDQLVLGEAEGVGGGQGGQQLALVGLVVQQHDLAGAVRSVELPPAVAVGRTAMARARLAALPAVPAIAIRPRISVPSMVKKRRPSLSIGLV